MGEWIDDGCMCWECKIKRRNAMHKKEESTLEPTMLSKTRVEELLDYATVYGAWDENTPNGATTDLSTKPMCDERRGYIKAIKNVLGITAV